MDEMFSGAGLSRLTDDGSFELDVNDEDGNIVIRADLPGVHAKDIDITLEEGVLTISAKRESHTKKTGHGYYVQERSTGDYSRSLRMPANISDDVHAALKNGVLQLTLKRTKEAQPRKIEIVS